jgi:hypothetical protein
MVSPDAGRGPENLVPDTVDVDGQVWHLVNRHNLSWGIQSGLAHFGELSLIMGEGAEEPTWRIDAYSTRYRPSQPGFSDWAEAFQDFVHSPGVSEAIARDSNSMY